MESQEGFWGAVLGAAAAAAGAARWWYHVRKMQNADSIDGGVTKSITFVLAEMRAEIARVTAQNMEMRIRVSALERENAAQQEELNRLRVLELAKATIYKSTLPPP